MWQFLRENWFWILLLVFFIRMHGTGGDAGAMATVTAARSAARRAEETKYHRAEPQGDSWEH